MRVVRRHRRAARQGRRLPRGRPRRAVHRDGGGLAVERRGPSRCGSCSASRARPASTSGGRRERPRPPGRRRVAPRRRRGRAAPGPRRVVVAARARPRRRGAPPPRGGRARRARPRGAGADRARGLARRPRRAARGRGARLRRRLRATTAALALGAGRRAATSRRTGPGGRSLGLRPLGFTVGVDRVRADGGVDLAFSRRRARRRSSPTSARSRTAATASPGRARRRPARRPACASAVSDGTKHDAWPTSCRASRPRRPGFEVALEQYFPDFALDEQQQPFTRSLEARNPAALLAVRRGAETHRAFVLQSMPGVHRIEPLGVVLLARRGRAGEERRDGGAPRAGRAAWRSPARCCSRLAVALAGVRGRGAPARRAARRPAARRRRGPRLALVLADGGGRARVAARGAGPDGAARAVRRRRLPRGARSLASRSSGRCSSRRSTPPDARRRSGRPAAPRCGSRSPPPRSACSSRPIQVAAASDVTTSTALPLAGIALAAARPRRERCRLSARDAARPAARRPRCCSPLAVAASLATAVLAGVLSLAAEGTYATPFRSCRPRPPRSSVSPLSRRPGSSPCGGSRSWWRSSSCSSAPCSRQGAGRAVAGLRLAAGPSRGAGGRPIGRGRGGRRAAGAARRRGSSAAPAGPGTARARS